MNEQINGRMWWLDTLKTLSAGEQIKILAKMCVNGDKKVTKLKL